MPHLEPRQRCFRNATKRFTYPIELYFDLGQQALGFAGLPG
jgi:hypothetical protein